LAGSVAAGHLRRRVAQLLLRAREGRRELVGQLEDDVEDVIVHHRPRPPAASGFLDDAHRHAVRRASCVGFRPIAFSPSTLSFVWSKANFAAAYAAVIDDLERQVFRVLVELARGAWQTVRTPRKFG
jgi:hypothetical protein